LGAGLEEEARRFMAATKETAEWGRMAGSGTDDPLLPSAKASIELMNTAKARMAIAFLFILFSQLSISPIYKASIVPFSNKFSYYIDNKHYIVIIR